MHTAKLHCSSSFDYDISLFNAQTKINSSRNREVAKQLPLSYATNQQQAYRKTTNKRLWRL